MSSKITIITGLERSGKTFLANNLSLIFNKPIFLDGRKSYLPEKLFYFPELTETTDLIIIDDVPVKNMLKLIFFLKENITVNYPYKEPKTFPTPKTIITTRGFSVKGQETFFKDKIEIIESDIVETATEKLIFNFKKVSL